MKYQNKQNLILKLNNIIESNNLHPNTVQGIIDDIPKYKDAVDLNIKKEIKQLIQKLSGGRKY